MQPASFTNTLTYDGYLTIRHNIAVVYQQAISLYFSSVTNDDSLNHVGIATSLVTLYQTHTLSVAEDADMAKITATLGRATAAQNALRGIHKIAVMSIPEPVKDIMSVSDMSPYDFFIWVMTPEILAQLGAIASSKSK